MSQTCLFKKDFLLLSPSLPRHLPNVIMTWTPLEKSNELVCSNRDAPKHLEHGWQPRKFEEHADSLQDSGVNFAEGFMGT